MVTLVRRRVHDGRLGVVGTRTSIVGALLGAVQVGRHVQVGVDASRGGNVGHFDPAELRGVGVDVLRRRDVARVSVDGNRPLLLIEHGGGNRCGVSTAIRADDIENWRAAPVCCRVDDTAVAKGGRVLLLLLLLLLELLEKKSDK